MKSEGTRELKRTAGSLEEILDELAGSGDVSRASLPKQRLAWKTDRLGLPAGTSQALLAELRSDRDEP